MFSYTMQNQVIGQKKLIYQVSNLNVCFALFVGTTPLKPDWMSLLFKENKVLDRENNVLD